ncbi:MAG: hypothetical protein IKU48_00140 [Clostridia bacterium]|nr:hypothetical protein [Clostridia bacterium]
MAIYKIADIFVEMTPCHDRLKKNAEKYLYTGNDVPENVMKVEISDEILKMKNEEHSYLSAEDCEYIFFGACFAVRILKYNGFVLHSSAISYNGNAYLFSANSGTGKSTHTGFWQDVFGKENVTFINDDKPAIREINGVFYASGSPFSGKSDLSNNIIVPLKAVCFIHRSEQNEIKRLTPSEAMGLLFEQILRPSRSQSIDLLFEVLDSFFSKVPVYSLGVTYSPDSAKFAYEALNQ